MLKAIELWDFESHEHSRIDDLSEGLSVIFGLSNAGKTSIIRALKLVAYNDFNPKSVRVGAKKCKVRIETDKGWVQVTRGKDDNLWEITPTGKKTMYRDKIGRVDPPPEAVEILGLGKVVLGDIPVPVNIMDQLESHFMLAGIGDKDASGSMRAQIIDEISGLSGIEGIIKEVSLDNRRAKREVKQSEEQMEEIGSQLHDESELDAEEIILAEAEEHLTNYQDASEATAQAKDMHDQGQDLDEQIDDVNVKLKTLPNGKMALAHIDNAKSAFDVVERAVDIKDEADRADDELKQAKVALKSLPDSNAALGYLDKATSAMNMAERARLMKQEADAVSGELKRAKDALDSWPDHGNATRHLDKAKTAMKGAASAKEILTEAKRAGDQVEEAELALKNLPDAAKVEGLLKRAQKSIDKASEARAMHMQAQSLGQEMEAREEDIEENREALKKARCEEQEMLKTIKVCPLNPSRPVSQECLKEAK